MRDKPVGFATLLNAATCWKKPLFALDISMIADETGNSSSPDINPLERFAVLEQNVKVYLSDRYSTYRWTPDFLKHIDNYLDQARANARKANAHKQEQQSERSAKYRDYESMRLANPAI